MYGMSRTSKYENYSPNYISIVKFHCKQNSPPSLKQNNVLMKLRSRIMNNKNIKVN